ncbi:MAG TPA: DEDD exonuclease domain-containing protein [Candidatus Kapabacteria bacterium]|nr:DEDD exonuclease domain-containing protein [Candidatus Kapabacteria bacterium]
MFLSETDFVICDVETTGYSAGAHRMTEICMLKLRKGILVDSFESLINPQQYISPEITRLTGITNSLVHNAPVFPSIAEEVGKFLEGSVFVAHNASFDWGFVNEELMRGGVQRLSNNVLCTVRLARRLVPGQASYSLGKLTASLGIPLRRHHRARGDCEATADLFRLLLERAEETYDVSECEDLLALQRMQRTVRPLTKKARTMQEQIQEFPDSPGVYYFRNAHDDILYIGKAANLRTRVRSYFHPAAQSVRKIRTLLRRSTSVTYEPMETELHALLREAKLIRHHQPEFNSAMRRKKLFPFLRLGIENDFPRIEVTTEIANDGAEYYGPFRTFGTAELVLDIINRLFKLRKCPDDLRPRKDFSPCFYYDIHRCEAPCAKEQTQKEYLAETERVRQFLSSNRDNVIRQIETVMHQHAERLEFEEATYLRDRMDELRLIFEKPLRIDTAVTQQHYVFAMQDEYAKGKYVFFFVRNGQLRKTLHERAKESLRDILEKEIGEVFSQEDLNELSQEASREMRIVAGWVRQHREEGLLVPVQPEAPAEECAGSIYLSLTKGDLFPA